MGMTDRTERIILGAILFDSKKIRQYTYLTPEDFTEKHRAIFRRMRDIDYRHLEIDDVSVTNELIRNGELESSGGVEYLHKLYQDYVTGKVKGPIFLDVDRTPGRVD